MIDLTKRVHFLGLIFSNTALFLGALSGAEIGSIAKEEEKIPKDFFYEMFDVTKLTLSNLVFQKGFSINSSGNILFSTTGDNKKMFLDDADSAFAESFSDYQIPKIYIRNASLEDIEKFATNLHLKIPEISPIVNKITTALNSECKNSTCIPTSNEIEKQYIQAIGGSKEDENGLNITSATTTINAQTLLAIGGSANYNDGMQSGAVVNTNRLIAIGGSKTYARGFVNENTLKSANLSAIGGSGTFAVGLENGIFKSLDANSILAIGGVGSYAYGIYNAGTITTNFLSAIGGKGVNNGGVYNAKEIQADVIVAIGIPNSGVAILNEGSKSKIDVKSLFIVSGKGYEPIANYGGVINAENIYLMGGNAIHNRDNGSITTRNLFVNDFSAIKGDIAFNSTGNSLLSFNLNGSNWKNDLPYLQIKEGNFTLLNNTNIEVNFSDKWILGNNLSYNTPYYLLSIVGKGELTDNRKDKNIKFSGLSSNPSTKIDKKGIAFAFIKEGVQSPRNPFNPTSSSSSDNLKDKLDMVLKNQNITQKLNSVSTKSSEILQSLIQANANGNKFQEVAINEGLTKIDSNPQLLVLLVQETDKTLQDGSLNIGNFSQRTIEYVGQKITDRINTLMFDQKSRMPTFSELMRKNALASNDDKIAMLELKKDNSVWLNVGGSYYQNSSASLNAFSALSLNTTIGYDTGVDVGADKDFILGGLFNYGKSFYYQNKEKQVLDVFTIGTYSNFSINAHEIQGVLSTSALLGESKIQNQKIGILQENYANNNFALNAGGFYKYRFELTEQHSLKPLVLANYTFLYTPASDMKTFVLDNSYDHIFALGAGGEYSFENSFMKNNFQLTGRYHISEITKSRSIIFRGAQTFINYDLNPSRTWAKLSYSAKFLLPSNFNLEVSLSSDISTSNDFLGTGNIGASYVW